jgi:DNA-binding protein H-NS
MIIWRLIFVSLLLLLTVNSFTQELAEAIGKARELVAEYGLTVQDIFPSGRGPSKSSTKSTSGGKVAAKYRDPATGQTWTGRGKAPKWIDGQERAQYLIA